MLFQPEYEKFDDADSFSDDCCVDVGGFLIALEGRNAHFHDFHVDMFVDPPVLCYDFEPITVDCIKDLVGALTVYLIPCEEFSMIEMSLGRLLRCLNDPLLLKKPVTRRSAILDIRSLIIL